MTAEQRLAYITERWGGVLANLAAGPKEMPWSQELVDALNKRQHAGQFHPFTCGSGNRTDEKHTDGEGVLVATPEGWKCPYCDYTQDWC